jgi:hypothetical protein
MLVLVVVVMGGACTGPVWADAPPPPPGAFTIVVLPDTQYYCSSANPAINAIFPEQTQWIADHRDSHNIQFVLHEGDIVNTNEPDQWDRARAAMDNLNGQVPYIMAPGNHDYEGGGGSRSSYFNDDRYFGPNSPYGTQETVGGYFEAGKTDNSYHLFRAGGREWMILALQFGPPDRVVEWASGVIAAYPNHSVILLTHAYMYSDDTRYDWATKAGEQRWNPHSYQIASLPGETVNDGEELWDKLVKPHPNARFVLSGHVLNDGAAFLTSIGSLGQVVHQVLANYQTGVDGSTNGGNGFMRLIDISPDGTMNVRAYSPHVDEFFTGPQQEFTLEMAPQGTGQGPQDLPLLLDRADNLTKSLEEGGLDLGELMEQVVENYDMARYLEQEGYAYTAKWILEVKVFPVLEQSAQIPGIFFAAEETISNARQAGVDNHTIQSLEGCLASARDSLAELDVSGTKTYLERIVNTSGWQEIPSIIPLVEEGIRELELAGDRKVFMAKGDYDRALSALQRCDHEAAQSYLVKALAYVPEPLIPCVAGLSLLALLSVGKRDAIS